VGRGCSWWRRSDPGGRRRGRAGSSAPRRGRPVRAARGRRRAPRRDARRGAVRARADPAAAVGLALLDNLDRRSLAAVGRPVEAAGGVERRLLRATSRPRAFRSPTAAALAPHRARRQRGVGLCAGARRRSCPRPRSVRRRPRSSPCSRPDPDRAGRGAGHRARRGPTAARTAVCVETRHLVSVYVTWSKITLHRLARVLRAARCRAALTSTAVRRRPVGPRRLHPRAGSRRPDRHRRGALAPRDGSLQHQRWQGGAIVPVPVREEQEAPGAPLDLMPSERSRRDDTRPPSAAGLADRSAPEIHDVRTADGTWLLLRRFPVPPGGARRAVVLVLHAMFSNGAYFDRPRGAASRRSWRRGAWRRGSWTSAGTGDRAARRPAPGRSTTTCGRTCRRRRPRRGRRGRVGRAPRLARPQPRGLVALAALSAGTAPPPARSSWAR